MIKAYSFAMSQKFPVNNFEQMKDTFQFNKNFIKNYDKESDEGYVIETNVQYLENCINLRMVYHFYQKE